MQSATKTTGGRLWLPYAMLLGLVLLFFSPWFVVGRVLAPLDIVREMYLPWRGESTHPSVHNHFVSDAVTQYLPYRMVAERSFEQDGYVGWNPLIFGGTAQSSNTMALSYDWAIQLHRIMDFWNAWHLGLIGRFLIAGFGMMVFLRSRGCGPWVSAAFGVAYMMNTEFVGWIYHQWALASFCWMPWFLWAMHRTREKTMRFGALAAIFLTMALLGATLQHSAFIIIAMACVLLGWIIERRDWRETKIVVLVGLLGAGLAASMLEPTMMGFIENLRAGHVRGGLIYAAGPLQPFMMAMAWPLTVYPFVLGSVQTLDLTKALVPGGLSFAFFGTIPVVLAIAGFLSRRVPWAAKLLVIAGLVIPLTPLVGLLYQRVSLLWILGGCWAGAVWLSTASEADVTKFAQWCWRVLMAAVLLWVVASIVLLVFRGALETLIVARVQAVAPSSQFGIFTDWMRVRATNLLGYLCVWNPWQLTGLTGLALSIWGMTRTGSKAFWPSVALMAGIAIQLSVFWWQWTTWSVERDPYRKSELVRIVQEEVGSSGKLAQISGPPAEVMFPPNTLVPLGVAVAGGYDSIHPQGMGSPSGKVWDFPGTTHFLGRIDEERPASWREVWSDGQWILLRNPAPSLGVVTLRSGLQVPLRPQDFNRGSFNTMEAAVPAGTERLEIFSNWNRGWKWKDSTLGVWAGTNPGPAGGVEIVFDHPVEMARAVPLRFDPSPPDWVLVVTVLSAIAIVALALSDDARAEPAHK